MSGLPAEAGSHGLLRRRRCLPWRIEERRLHDGRTREVTLGFDRDFDLNFGSDDEMRRVDRRQRDQPLQRRRPCSRRRLADLLPIAHDGHSDAGGGRWRDGRQSEAIVGGFDVGPVDFKADDHPRRPAPLFLEQRARGRRTAPCRAARAARGPSRTGVYFCASISALLLPWKSTSMRSKPRFDARDVERQHARRLDAERARRPRISASHTRSADSAGIQIS